MQWKQWLESCHNVLSLKHLPKQFVFTKKPPTRLVFVQKRAKIVNSHDSSEQETNQSFIHDLTERPDEATLIS